MNPSKNVRSHEARPRHLRVCILSLSGFMASSLPSHPTLHLLDIEQLQIWTLHIVNTLLQPDVCPWVIQICIEMSFCVHNSTSRTCDWKGHGWLAVNRGMKYSHEICKADRQRSKSFENILYCLLAALLELEQSCLIQTGWERSTGPR